MYRQRPRKKGEPCDDWESYRSARARMCPSLSSTNLELRLTVHYSFVIYLRSVDTPVVPGSAIDDRVSHGAGKRRMGDTDSGKSEAARWSRLLRWLDVKHGMDANQLAVEARSVEGT